MAACATWKYKDVTPAVFQKLQALGRARGFTIPGTPSGQFTIQVAGLQVGFQYGWDSRSGVLLLTCVSKPMLVGCSTIKGYADNIVRESGGKAVI